ncbi:acid protease [Auriculariales sp. MPI-PUGE-AT-0066]|nr:acid protease [Auriculariales sp. MPI-PUGE-AT-0066]
MFNVLTFVVVACAAAVPQPQSDSFSLSVSRRVASEATLRENGLQVVELERRRSGSLMRREPIQSSFAVYSFVADIGVGSPATNYSVIVDTGSANTWVGAQKSYKRTATSKATGSSIYVSWGSGNTYVNAKEYYDQVTLSSSLVVASQQIGGATSTRGFDGFEGILGLGPTGLTDGSTTGKGEIPSISDNLFANKLIDSNTVGLAFVPQLNGSGIVVFGSQVPEGTIVGDITWSTITNSYPASAYWGIDARIAYGGRTFLTTAGAIDAGSTLINLSTDMFRKYQSATGAILDSSTGFLRVTSAQYAAMQPLEFVVEGRSFALPSNAQIWPRSLNTVIPGGVAGRIYLAVVDKGENSGEGLDFILGITFLERFYATYDVALGRIGLAETLYTNATSN